MRDILDLFLIVMAWGFLILMALGFLILVFTILVGFYRGIRKVLGKKTEHNG